MSYRLDPALPASETLRVRRLGRVGHRPHIAGLTADRHIGVHSARKCFKRLRSLLLLARPGMPDPVFVTYPAESPVSAKGLAAARDAHALFDAVNTLERNTEPGLGDRPIDALANLAPGTSPSRPNAISSKSSASQALQMLLELRPRLARLVVYPDDFTPISKGLESCYRDARRQFKSAFSSNDPESAAPLAQGRPAALAADAIANPMLAVRTRCAGRGRTWALPAFGGRPRHCHADASRDGPDHDIWRPRRHIRLHEALQDAPEGPAKGRKDQWQAALCREARPVREPHPCLLDDAAVGALTR